jgi:hypothetical protein
MDILVQLALPEMTLAARDVGGTVRTPDADCLIWIKGTTSPPNRMATLKQTSHQIRRPQAGTGLIRLPRSVPLLSFASGTQNHLFRKSYRMVCFPAPFEYGMSGKWLELLKEIAPHVTNGSWRMHFDQTTRCNAEQGVKPVHL